MTYHDFVQSVKKDTPQILLDTIYRKISYPLSYMFYLARCTPNQISVLSILLSLFGGAVIVFGQISIGLSLFVIGYLLDFCDGNVYRALCFTHDTKEPRKDRLMRGLMLENVNTNLSFVGFMGAIGIYLLYQKNNHIYLYFCIITILVRLLMRYARLHHHSLAIQHGIYKSEQMNSIQSLSHIRVSIVKKTKLYLSKGVFTFNITLGLFFVLSFFPTHIFTPVFVVFYAVQIVYDLFRFFDTHYRW